MFSGQDNKVFPDYIDIDDSWNFYINEILIELVKKMDRIINKHLKNGDKNDIHAYQPNRRRSSNRFSPSGTDSEDNNDNNNINLKQQKRRSSSSTNSAVMSSLQSNKKNQSYE